MASASPAKPGRVEWVDVAKGFCIIMVVTMHSAYGVEKATGVEGWLHDFVEFTRPFRMPDFFLIAGLFLSRSIDRPWREYLDGKVIHFAYFYVLWMAIQVVLKTGMAGEGLAAIPGVMLFGLIEPYGVLWFIYLLPVFFLTTKLVRGVHPAIVLAVGALLEVAQIHTGSTTIDEFAGRFVFFYAGYALAPSVFAIARRAQEIPSAAMAALVVWALFNGLLVVAGWSALPGVGLLLGGLGAVAVVTGSALLAGTKAAVPLRYCGENSIVIYLAFFLPMAVTRTVLLKLDLIPDVGTVSLIVTIVAVIGPLILLWIVRDTWFGFLFKRPGWARLDMTPRLAPVE